MALDLTLPSMTQADWSAALGSVRENFRAFADNDDNVWQGQNLSGLAAATDKVLTASWTGASTYATVEIGSARTDADATRTAVIGLFSGTQSASHKTLATIEAYTDGGTANQRGGQLRIYTKPNGSTTMTERMRVEAAGTAAFGGLASVASGGLLQVFEAAATQRTLGVWDTTAFAADVGGSILFGGKTTATPTGDQFAVIKGAKENATSGNNASYLSFLTRASGGSLTERLRIASTGIATFSAGINERGRTVPMGEWIDFTPTLTAATGTWTGGTVVARYMFVGKTMFILFRIYGSTLSNATASCSVTVPGGFSPAQWSEQIALTNLAWGTAVHQTNGFIVFTTSPGGAGWGAGAAAVTYEGAFEVA